MNPSTSCATSSCEDIEDVFENNEQLKDNDIRATRETCPSVLKLKTQPFDPNREQPITTLKDSIPGTQNIFVKTWGCSHNISDSEYMCGLLSNYGYQIITEDEQADKADLWLLNSCTVKGPSQDHFMTMTRKAKSNNKPVVVAGCVPQGDKKITELKNISVVGVQQIDRVVEVVEETLKGHTVQLYSLKKREDETKQDSNDNAKRKRKDGGARLNLPKIRKNALVEIIPINTGCLNQCTYCKTKHARGDLGSYPINEICERIEQVVLHEGVKEIWLTSEDTGAYGLDINTNIAELLTHICSLIDNNIEIKKKVMIRIGMTNPPYILEHLLAVCQTLNHPNFYSFLHLPVQSASDKVLDDMRRKYNCKDFETVCDFLLKHVPRIHIATDIICGFPTESEEDFDQTLKLIDKYKFVGVNISQFYPRPGTVAAKMKKLNTKVVKDRSRRLTNLFKSYIPFIDRKNEIHRVLVTSMANDDYHYCGHNKCYDHFIIVPDDKIKQYNIQIMGSVIEVKIIEIGKHFIKSEIVFDNVDKIKNNDSLFLPNNGLSDEENMSYLKGEKSIIQLNQKQIDLSSSFMKQRQQQQQQQQSQQQYKQQNNNNNKEIKYTSKFIDFRNYFVIFLFVIVIIGIIIQKI